MWLLDKMLRRIVRQGQLTAVTVDGKRHVYGAPDPARPPVTVRFTDAATPNRIAREPRLGAAEAKDWRAGWLWGWAGLPGRCAGSMPRTILVPRLSTDS